MKKNEKNGWKRIWDRHNVLCSVLIMAAALGAAWVLCSAILPHTRIDNDAPVVFTLAVAVVSRVTRRMIYGIAASLIGTVTVNYFFTYPYAYFTLKIEGYTIDFVCFLAVSLLVSLLTYQLRGETARAVRQERENYALYQRNLELEEKRAAAEIAAAKEKMHGNLLRAVSHDLRTPLTSIIGASSSYLENTGSLNEADKRRLIQAIDDDANWLLHMVENLLSVTKIRQDGARLTKTLEPLEEVVSEAVSRLKKRIPDASIRVTTPENFIMVPMDATLIEQVIINLLENGIYHSGSTEPMELTVIAAERQVYFRIRDHGHGIREDLLPRIFDGYADTPASSGDSRKGMGIGLSICKTIIMAHNGRIWAQNLSDGALFTFTLPLGDEPYES